MINVRIANISPKVTKILPIPPKSKEFKENFTIGIVIEYKVPNGCGVLKNIDGSEGLRL